VSSIQDTQHEITQILGYETMKRLKYFALAALVAFAACDEGNESVVPEPDTGTISGTVTVDGQGQAGVTVTLTPTGATATTAANGDYSFSNVEAGAYTVAISGMPSDAAFATTSQAAVITDDGQVIDRDFAGFYIRTSAITASVSVPSVGALAGVAVSISGMQSASQVTGASGTANFSGLRAGAYTVSAVLGAGSAALYDLDVNSVNVDLDVDELQAVVFTATPKTISTITGRMYIDEASKNNAFDAGNEDNLTIADVDVVIEGVSVGVFETIQTDANGEFTLSNLPAANYRISLDTSPFNGAVALGTPNDIVITLGVADTEVVNFGFDIITQRVVIGGFLGCDEDNGCGGATRVTAVPGLDMDLFATAFDADNFGPVINDNDTGSNGFATISFARSADTDPFGGPSDNVIFIRETGIPAAFASIVQNGEDVIEVPFPAKDSIVTSDDVFDYLNSSLTISFMNQETDGDTYENIAVKIDADTTTLGSFDSNPTDANGMVYFPITATGNTFVKTRPLDWPLFVANADIPYPPMGAPTFTFSESFDAAAGATAGSWLRFNNPGTYLPTDTVFIGTGNINWDLVEFRGKTHRERNDEQNFQSGDDDFAVVDNSQAILEYDNAGTWTAVGVPQVPSVVDGSFVIAGASNRMYRFRSNTQNAVIPANNAILNDTTVMFDVDGADQRMDICPLRDAGTTSYATCSTFAFKTQNNVIFGTIRYRDGTFAPNGTQVRVSTDADNTIQGRASSAGDTIVTVAGGAGVFVTNATVREGNYLVEPISNSLMTFFPDVNGGEKSVEVEGFAVAGVVATATPARSALAGGASPSASFHGYNPDTSIEGAVVNDRDEDGNTIDIDEALIGVTVNLVSDDPTGGPYTNGAVVATTVTSATGSYSFPDLYEGGFTVSVDGTPANAVVLSAFGGGGASDELRMLTDNTVTDIGDTSPNPLPFWDYATSTVTNPGTIDGNRPDGEQFTFLFTNGTVSGDVSGNGGLPVTVTLTRCLTEADDPLLMPAAGTCDADDAGTFQTFITAADGLYNFTNLREGIYEVEVVEESVGLTTGGAPFLVFIDANGDLEVVDFSIS
jgi:hypothetical protein